jgi:hypothetical protein
VARHAGDRIIGEHDHADPDDEKHEELYFVHTGAARFVVDGDVIEAPAGTWRAWRTCDPGAPNRTRGRNDRDRDRR